MKNSKVNNNRNPLTDEEVKKAENFDGVLTKMDASQGNFFQKNWGYIASVFVLGIIAVFALNKSELDKTLDKDSEKFELIAPIDGLDVQKRMHSIKAGEAGQIVTETGSIINYPANAFLDSNRNPVTGNIELQFREFHDVVEIFASGIPMEYDSASNKYHFESAGMFEINGVQNGRQLSINPDAPLVVELSSKQHGDYFNIYKLDENGKWNYIKKDTAKGIYENLHDSIQLAQLPQQIKELEKRENKAKKDAKKADKSFQKLLKDNGLYQPQKANNDLYSIKLESDKKEFPELAPFEKILFEITEENKDFTSELAKKDWDDIQLKKKNDGEYLLIMFDNMKKYKFTVRPVVSSSDIAGANTTFENLFAKYDNKLGGKLSQEKLKRDSLKTQFKLISDSINILNNFASMEAYEMSEVEKTTATVKRIFTIDEFGIFNSDCPQKLPQGILFEPVFVNAKNIKDTLSFDHIYMAELNKNALYSLYGYWGKPKNRKNIEEEGTDEAYLSQEISFNPYHKTVVWGITIDNRLAIIKPAKMGEIKKGGSMDIEMFVTEEKVTDLDKIRKLLGFS